MAKSRIESSPLARFRISTWFVFIVLMFAYSTHKTQLFKHKIQTVKYYYVMAEINLHVLETLMDSHGHNKSDLGRKLGLSRHTVHGWFQRETIDVENLKALEDLYGVPRAVLSYGYPKIDGNLLRKLLDETQRLAKELGKTPTSEQISAIIELAYTDASTSGYDEQKLKSYIRLAG